MKSKEDDAAVEVDGEVLVVYAFHASLEGKWSTEVPAPVVFAKRCLLIVGHEAADKPYPVGEEVNRVGLIAGRVPQVTNRRGCFNAGDYSDLAIVCRCGCLFVCEIRFDKVSRFQFKGWRDVADFVGDVGFRGAAGAVASGGKGYDETGDGEECQGEGEESKEVRCGLH